MCFIIKNIFKFQFRYFCLSQWHCGPSLSIRRRFIISLFKYILIPYFILQMTFLFVSLFSYSIPILNTYIIYRMRKIFFFKLWRGSIDMNSKFIKILQLFVLKYNGVNTMFEWNTSTLFYIQNITFIKNLNLALITTQLGFRLCIFLAF